MARRIIQTVKSREVENISRPEEIYHDTGAVVIPWNARPEKVVCSKCTLPFKIEYDKF